MVERGGEQFRWWSNNQTDQIRPGGENNTSTRLPSRPAAEQLDLLLRDLNNRVFEIGHDDRPKIDLLIAF